MSELDNVKVGDLVVVNSRNGDAVLAVTAIHKLHILIGNRKFRKSCGSETSCDVWNMTSIHVPKEGEIERIRELRWRKKTIAVLEGTKWKLFSTDFLVSITEQIKQQEELCSK